MAEIMEKRIGRKEIITTAGKNGGVEFVRSSGSTAGQVLSDENIRKLGFLVLRVDESLGGGEQHQDIEWADDGADFILVQARPVTALPRYTCPEIKDQPDIWSNANFRDAIPMVQSTLNWSIMKIGLNMLFDSLFKTIGCRMPEGLQLVKLFQGRAYLNLSIQQWLMYDALGLAPGVTNSTLGGHQPEIRVNEKKPYSGIKGLKRLWRALKFLAVMARTKRQAGKSFAWVEDTMETANLAKIKSQQKEKADRAWLEIRRRLPLYRRILIKYWPKQSLKGAEMREKAKSVMVKSYESFSVVLREIGQRLAGRGIIENHFDLYHCTRSEILSILNGYWDGKGLAVLVAERKARRKEMEAISPPDLIIGDVPRFVKPVAGATGSALTGMGVAAGKASGTAGLIHHPHEGGKLKDGDVLVAPSTDPGWTPLFLRASAIVMETGGFLSHGSIVAREYGIPAVVNIPGVMKAIKDKQIITVDGDEGKIYL